MAAIECVINGNIVQIDNPSPTMTLLDWLREDVRLTGTKEGCNEGDCGACTVLISDIHQGKLRHRSLNACILFLPQLQGKSVRTVEGLATPHGRLHSVQHGMVSQHGSQCGFCTPGIVMSLVAAQANGQVDHDTVLAGNLCRCTGYASIVRAAEVAMDEDPPHWIEEDKLKLQNLDIPSASTVDSAQDWIAPTDLDTLTAWYADNPDATLVAGATDVGLWVTKQFRVLPKLAFLAGVTQLQRISESRTHWRIGAGVTITRLQDLLADQFVDFATMLNRYGSLQVRNAATIGGNIANGSPIGDAPPALLALNAELELRQGHETRIISLQDFFIAYGQQDRRAGELVTAIIVPKQQDNLRCYKISKRFDQDISALCGCFSLSIVDEYVREARIAFGGMAGIPKRATFTEAALIGQAWNAETVAAGQAVMAQDYSPMSDMRASAEYRLQSAQNLLMRYYIETSDSTALTRVQEVEA